MTTSSNQTTIKNNNIRPAGTLLTDVPRSTRARSESPSAKLRTSLSVEMNVSLATKPHARQTLCPEKIRGRDVNQTRLLLATNRMWSGRTMARGCAIPWSSSSTTSPPSGHLLHNISSDTMLSYKDKASLLSRSSPIDGFKWLQEKICDDNATQIFSKKEPPERTPETFFEKSDKNASMV